MDKARRYRLHFGPYRTPRFRYGSVVRDEIRGDVRIVGLTDAPIPWPIVLRVNTRGETPTLVIYKGLAQAAREGKPLPPEVYARRRQAVQKLRRRRSVRRHLTRAPGLNPPWTIREDEFVRKLSPKEAAARTGRTLAAVYKRRQLLRKGSGK
ncbi:MAG: hypothetical protein KY475_22650 [Planctomycetes bacterium]|nr:hypothetical protein [Planctomycetota bacterium]